MRAMLSFDGRTLALLVACAPVLTGCPLQDDYYVASEAGPPSGGSGGVSGKATAGRAGLPSAGSSAGGSAGLPSGAAGEGSGGGCGDCAAMCTTERFQAKGYAFCSAELTFPEAEAVCARQNMTLARVQNEEENAWIWQRSVVHFHPSLLRAFLGGTDAESEGQWRWANGEAFWSGGIDGSAVSNRYTRWAPDQPANFSPVTLTSEDCLTINFSDGSWNDMRCEVPLPFVCEQR